LWQYFSRPQIYVKTCKTVGIDPLVAVSQMELETAHLTSKAAQPPRRNPAGIGITGPGVAGVSSPNWNKAVRAHVGRLAAFALPKGEGTQAQKALIVEALAVRPLPPSKRGSAARLKGLSRNWATDPRYAHKIARIGKEIHA
jgi:Mannosyl-glycoprotein endo-beta-N-acetylglucosaminidase